MLKCLRQIPEKFNPIFKSSEPSNNHIARITVDFYVKLMIMNDLEENPC